MKKNRWKNWQECLGGESITETVLSNAREMKEMAQQQKNTRVK